MKTAVEYLIKEFSDILGPLETTGMQDLLLMDAIVKAKEIEQQKLKSAYEKGKKYKKPLKDSNPITKYLKQQ